MGDVSQESWRRLKAAQDQLREFFSCYGYRVLETPILEPTELFLRKSGGELAARMYSFTDPGGSPVSLRPEYTASILRYYLESDSHGSFPHRIQYSGPVFRYEEDKNTYRQFIQAGAELLGSYDARADAEILSLSHAALSSLGLSGHSLELGDLGMLHRLLKSVGLSERSVVFILGSIGELKVGQEGLIQVTERAKQLRLLALEPRGEHSRSEEHLSTAISGLNEEDARLMLYGLLKWAEVGSLGQRRPSDVVERLLRKFRGTDEPAILERGLEIAYRLARIRGEPGASLKEVEALIKSYGLDPSQLDGLKHVIDLLYANCMNDAMIILDFGLARGLAYYTGNVFELKHPAIGTPLGGGGRYDGLARALGSGSNIPALGFAFTLETLLDAIERSGNSRAVPEDEPACVLVGGTSDEAYGEALRLAEELRSMGTAVAMEVNGMNIEESLAYAKAKGMAEVIAVHGDGNRTTYPVQSTS